MRQNLTGIKGDVVQKQWLQISILNSNNTENYKQIINKETEFEQKAKQNKQTKKNRNAHTESLPGWPICFAIRQDASEKIKNIQHIIQSKNGMELKLITKRKFKCLIYIIFENTLPTKD